MDQPVASPIPAFLNAESGTAEATIAALEQSGRFALHRVEPAELAAAIHASADRGVRRVLIAGGDGSVATAASVLAGTPVELAILPAGTLNHFARDYGIPLDPEASVHLAATGTARPTDVAYVDDHLFLNTSSVGAYVRFVRLRERLEPRFGYTIASLFALCRAYTLTRPFRLHLEIEGQSHLYRTSLAFIAVGERELRIPILGGRIPQGRRALHVIIPRTSLPSRLVALGLISAVRGLRAVASSVQLDSFLVDRCRIEMRRPHSSVALDGELLPITASLDYHIARDALLVVRP